MGMVTTREDHSTVRGYLQVKFVKYPLILVHFAQLLIQVLCDVERLDGLLIISHIPNLHCQVVPTKDVVVTRGCKLCLRYGIYYLCEEMLTRWVLSVLKLCCMLAKLTANPKVTVTNVALTGRE